VAVVDKTALHKRRNRSISGRFHAVKRSSAGIAVINL